MFWLLGNNHQKSKEVDISPFFPRPFRKLDDKGSLQWDKINQLEKGKIYKEVK